MHGDGQPLPPSHQAAMEPASDDADAQESPEKQQEAELRAKYGGLVPRQPNSAFLQKKLQQRKFFDSGDYNMQKGGKAPSVLMGKVAPGAAAKPTLQPVPDQVEKAPVRSPHRVAAPPVPSPVPATLQEPPVVDTAPQVVFRGRRSTDRPAPATPTTSGAPGSPTGMEIPRPETVPQRKSSIIFPNAASKLSPQPLHHTNPPDPLQALHEPRLSAMTE